MTKIRTRRRRRTRRGTKRRTKRKGRLIMARNKEGIGEEDIP